MIDNVSLRQSLCYDERAANATEPDVPDARPIGVDSGKALHAVGFYSAVHLVVIATYVVEAVRDSLVPEDIGDLVNGEHFEREDEGRLMKVLRQSVALTFSHSTNQADEHPVQAFVDLRRVEAVEVLTMQQQLEYVVGLSGEHGIGPRIASRRCCYGLFDGGRQRHVVERMPNNLNLVVPLRVQGLASHGCRWIRYTQSLAYEGGIGPPSVSQGRGHGTGWLEAVRWNWRRAVGSVRRRKRLPRPLRSKLQAGSRCG